MTSMTSLPDRLTGQVVTPGDADYEEARRVYNFMIDRHPAVIVRCADTRDVRAVVDHAHDSGRDLAVRGGGHSVPGFGTGDGAIVADLSPMNHVLVDPSGGPRASGAGPPGPY
jgi:FAD/FMN-containing dehydrogenase